jgi:hypothetical protein
MTRMNECSFIRHDAVNTTSLDTFTPWDGPFRFLAGSTVVPSHAFRPSRRAHFQKNGSPRRFRSGQPYPEHQFFIA